MAEPGANRRRHFRLPYPPGAGPVLTSADAALAVVELSERGLRFAPGARTFAPGERVSGVLRFPDGAEVPVEGVTVRDARAFVTVRLVFGIGLDRMLAEQKRILRNYPAFLRGVEDDE
jgi:hypothetical protein